MQQQQPRVQNTNRSGQAPSHFVSTPCNASNVPQNSNRFREIQYQQVSLPISSNVQQVYSVQESQSQHNNNNNTTNNNNNSYMQQAQYGNVVTSNVNNQYRYQNNDNQQRVGSESRSRAASKDLMLNASSDPNQIGRNYVSAKFRTKNEYTKEGGNMDAEENPNSAPDRTLYHHATHGGHLSRGTDNLNNQNNSQVHFSEYNSSPYSSPVKTMRPMTDPLVSSSPMDYSNMHQRSGPYIHPSQSQPPQMIMQSPNTLPTGSVQGSPNPAYFKKSTTSTMYTLPEQTLVLTPPVIQESTYYGNSHNNTMRTHVLNISHHDVNSIPNPVVHVANNSIVNPHQGSPLGIPKDPYPPFIMLKKPDITIYEIFTEWYYGLNGKEAVYSLNSKGSRWRTRTSADRMFYRKRKTVVDYIILVIRHLKMLYNIHDDNHTIPDNMIDEAVPYQTSVGAATRRNSFTKTEAHEVSDELARVYDKLDLGKDWGSIIAGKKIIETTRDINYKGLTSESWHNALLTGKNRSQEQQTSKIGINCICNPENRLIRGILYELQNALKRKSWSWARFANYLLQIKKDNSMREFDESKEDVEVEKTRGESEHSSVNESQNGKGSMSRKRRHQDSTEIESSSCSDSDGKTKEKKEGQSSLNIEREELQNETVEEKTKEQEEGPTNKKAKFADDNNNEKGTKEDATHNQEFKYSNQENGKTDNEAKLDNVEGSLFQKDMKIEVDTGILDQSMDTKLMKGVEMPYASSASTPSAFSTIQSSSLEEGQERKEGMERACNETEIE